MYNPTDLLYTQRCANATSILYTQHFLLKIRNSIKFRLSVIPTKNPSFQRKMRVKNITVNVSVRVSVTVKVSLVLFVSSNTFGASSVAICGRCVYKILVAFAQRCVINLLHFTQGCVYNIGVKTMA